LAEIEPTAQSATSPKYLVLVPQRNVREPTICDPNANENLQPVDILGNAIAPNVTAVPPFAIWRFMVMQCRGWDYLMCTPEMAREIISR
jgi:hypothetical protein